MKGALDGRVAVITGAAAGVGRAVAERFRKNGAKLGLIARDEAALAELARELEAAGGVVSVFAADVADADKVQAAALQFENALGPIDFWVNDAMLTVFSPLHEMTPKEYRRVTEVTYLGAVHGAMAALRVMRPRGAGHIINIGSALAYRGIPLQSAYCGAKHGIRAFTASLRSELAHDRMNIKVSILELPAMNTPQFDWARTHMPRQPKPMGTIYQPEAAAEAVVRAAHTGAREYWVGGSTFMTIVGNMVAPEFMDWYLARNAVEGQQTEQEVRPDRIDNLFRPVTALHRTHGVFGKGAKAHALVLSGAWTRVAVIVAGAAFFFALGAILF